MFDRLERDEHGAALIISLMVAFVVLLLSIYVVDLSIHSSTQSSYDRKRVLSVSAAEAGLNQFWALLQTTAPEHLPCSAPFEGRVDPPHASLDTSPGVASFSVRPTYYADAEGTSPIDCTQLGQSTPPASVLVTSVGRTDGTVPRTMQAFMKLSGSRSGGYEAAIIAENGLTMSNNLTVDGGNLLEASVYVNDGNLDMTSGNMTIKGSVYVHDGWAKLGGSTNVTGDVWAWGAVTIDGPATVSGDAWSSSSSLGVLGGTGGTINGCAKAATSIDPRLRVPTGCKVISPSDIHPPDQPLPHICWASGDGSCQDIDTEGYTIVPETSCAAARAYLTSTTISGNVIVRLAPTSPCVLTFATNDRINFTGNLIVFSDYGIDTSNKVTWTGPTSGKLSLIVGYREGIVCDAAGTYDIRISNNTNFVNSTVALYSPCTIHLSNNGKLEPKASFQGQILGGTVKVENNFAMKYIPVIIPGVSPISGFRQDVVYVREVA
jgi:hypothetical protein